MYVIQIGKGRGRYTRTYTFSQAIPAYLYYNAINVHSGGKKKLLKNGKLLHRLITEKSGYSTLVDNTDDDPRK